ncbi:MAG: fructokinase, partial [Paracoccaceae bacterium]
VSDRPTTLAFVNLVDGQATYNFFDENSAGKMLAPSDMPNLPKGISALFFGGISLACEPCADAYATLLESAAEERVVMLDPNIRANFIENPIQYRDRLDRMMALSDIVKISDEDLNWIFPDAETLTIKVRKLLNLGPKIVVLTRGSEGATAFTASGSEIFVPASIVDVVDTVGAGDTFNAGFLASLVDSDVLYKPAIAGTGDATISHALEFAVRVAAVAVSRAGADPPWVNEL